MTCPPSLLHQAQARNRRGSPMSFAFGGARRPNPWHQASHTLYEVKNMPLYLTTSASRGLTLRLAISRRADHPLRAPHLLLSPCEVAVLPQYGNRVEDSVAWHTIKPPGAALLPPSLVWIALTSHDVSWRPRLQGDSTSRSLDTWAYAPQYMSGWGHSCSAEKPGASLQTFSWDPSKDHFW